MNSDLVVVEPKGDLEGYDVSDLLDYSQLDFEFVEETPDANIVDAVITSLKTAISFVPEIGLVIDYLETKELWQHSVLQEELNRNFETYLQNEGITLSQLSSRKGHEAVFMVQRYTETPEDGSAVDYRKGFYRVTPVGFGADIESALTYALADEDARLNGDFQPDLPRSTVHSDKEQDLNWSIYMSVELIGHRVKISKNRDPKGLYEAAKARAKSLGVALIGKFDYKNDALGQIWRNYQQADQHVFTIRNSEIRNIVNSANDERRRGLKRIAKLEDEYRRAASAAKAARFFSHLSQVLSVASSVQNYVEARSAGKAASKIKEKRETLFGELSSAVGDLSSQLKSQKNAIDKLSDKINDNEKSLIGVLVPYDILNATQKFNEAEYQQDGHFIDNPGPVLEENYSEFSFGFEAKSLRIEVKAEW